MEETQYYAHFKIIKCLFGILFNISKNERDISNYIVRILGIIYCIIKNRDSLNNKNTEIEYLRNKKLEMKKDKRVRSRYLNLYKLWKKRLKSSKRSAKQEKNGKKLNTETIDVAQMW